MEIFFPEEIQNIILGFIYFYTEIYEDNHSLERYLNSIITRRTVTSSLGNVAHYVDNVLHSENDLPAVVQTDGTSYWYKNGKFHRSTLDNDGYVLPAIIFSDMRKEWFRDGEYHRICRDKYGTLLPAIIDWYNRSYYICGVFIPQNNYEKILRF